MIKKILIAATCLYVYATFYGSLQQSNTRSWPAHTKYQLSRITPKQWLTMAGIGATATALWQIHKRYKIEHTNINPEALTSFPDNIKNSLHYYLFTSEQIEYSRNPPENSIILDCSITANSPLCPLTKNSIKIQNNSYENIYDYIKKNIEHDIEDLITQSSNKIQNEPLDNQKEALFRLLQFFNHLYQTNTSFKKSLNNLAFNKTIIIKNDNPYFLGATKNTYFWGVSAKDENLFTGKNIYGYLLTYLKNNITNQAG